MLRVLLVFLALLSIIPARAADFDHRLWNELLQRHVRVLQGGMVTQVDYGGLLEKQAVLKEYLQELAAVDRAQFDSWMVDYQLAFLINAYNASTIELILTKYPQLDSIKDLGTFLQSPWKKRFIFLLGKERSLDEIEHDLIRGSGRYNDPRIHFAVNCASVGCPALRAEAYRGSVLQHQLAEATALFLKDRTRNRLAGRNLEVSPIFKWYGEDFRQGWKGVSSLRGFFADHAADLGLTEMEKKQMLSGEIDISFMDYDWKLNRIP